MQLLYALSHGMISHAERHVTRKNRKEVAKKTLPTERVEGEKITIACKEQ